MNNEKETQKTVLVTGGNGFIGTMVCKLLVGAGHNVINIDRSKKQQEGVTLYPFDINNNQLKGVIQLTQPDTIIHLAADHEVGRSVTEPHVFYDNNVRNTIALLNHAVESGVKNFIFSSSSSVYGDVLGFPTPEESPKVPMSPYGRTKAMVEDMLKDYANAYDINFVALRYFNAAGADPEGDVGELREHETHIVPLAIAAAKQGKTFKIFGDKYPTDDGTCVRDYVHVMDLADAHIKALNYASQNPVAEVFNLGSGEPASNKQLIDAVQKHAGTMSVEMHDNRPGDPAYLVADITKVKEILDWSPTQSSIDNVVSTAVQWYNKMHKKEIQ